MMMKLSLVLSLLLCAVVAVKAQNDLNDDPQLTSKMTVHIPESIKGTYDHREALFGMPAYGGSIVANVMWVDDHLCSPTIASTSKRFPADLKPPYIMMVNRGECTFVTKVRNAQRNGAAAVLIADNVCLCKDENCRSEYQYDTCEDSEPTMADDGSGGDVSIPSFLLFKHDADRMKKMLQGGSSVQVEMTWKLPNPDKRVEYSLWSVPTDSLSQDFLRSFKQVAVKLDKQAHFTPRMYIYDGKQAGCVGRDLNCANLCTNNGRYCATDPDNDINRGISGADVVTESLRRLCIWKEYGETDGIGREWWDYIEEFYERCHTYTKFNDIDCVDEAMRRAKVDRDYVRTCMRSSGGLEGDKPNSYLDVEIQARNDKGVVILPTVTVNGVPLRGALTSTNIFDAICSGYAPGTRPDVCAQCSNCNNVASCVNNNGICLSGTTGRGGSSARTAVVPKGRVSSGTFVFSMLLIVGAFAGAGFWYYQRSREEMRDHVRGILAEYMPLEDQDGNGLGQAMMGGPGAGAGGAGGAPGVGMPGFVTNVGQSFNNMTSQFTG